MAPPNHRRCISCRRLGHRTEFWRIIRLHPSHQVQLDRGMGRSVYLCPTEACLNGAQRKNRLGKVLKAPVPPDLYQSLWDRLQTVPQGGRDRAAPFANNRAARQTPSASRHNDGNSDGAPLGPPPPLGP